MNQTGQAEVLDQELPVTGEVHCQCFPVLSRLSVGFELLRKMGWKEGQGVGPRVKRKPRRQKPGKPIGCGHWYGAHLGLFV